MNLRDIKEKAENLLKHAKINRLPVSIERVVRHLNIRLKTAPLEEDISGFLRRQDNKIFIVVNQLHPLTRRRFSIAHEIGHLMLNHEGDFFIGRTAINFRDSRSSRGEDEQEIDANAFAAELLMPEQMLAKDAKRGLIDISKLDKMERLARRYQVSVQALNYRLINLGLIS